MLQYPLCSELAIQYVEDNIKHLTTTTQKFREYYDTWDEQLEYFKRKQQDTRNTDVNLVDSLAKWTNDMYSDGLSGLKALYDAEQYEHPPAGSQASFYTTRGGKQYDMTFAVRVVRRMFLRVRPGLQASISGLEGQALLERMEDLLAVPYTPEISCFLNTNCTHEKLEALLLDLQRVCSN
jgi:hypothetical protein